MKIKSASDYKLLKSSVVTIGTFDGVHVGHQKIISKLVNIAKSNALQAVVLTFFPHPRMVLQRDTNIKLINTIDEKTRRLEKHGVDHLIVKKFTREFSRLTAQEFVKTILVDKLHVKHIIIGYDHHFGRNRTANIDDLRDFGAIYNFEVTEISAQDIDAVTVSSTKIRNALDNGNIKSANTYLGYDFMLTGTVVKGKGIGKDLGFPTANIQIEESYKLIPKHGVYIVKSKFKNEALFGMMNIGINPTVDGKIQSIEVNFFNFDTDIYGEKIEIKLLSRIRDEQKFDSLEALKLQLQQDRKVAEEFMLNYND